MLRNVYGKSMFDRRISINWWFLGLAFFVVMIVAFYPIVQDNTEQFNKLLESYPKELLAAFGMSEMNDITSPAGYLHSQLFSFMLPLIMMIYAIGFGSSTLAGEEEQKTLDLLLANPVSRTQVVLQKMAAMITLVAILGLFVFGSLWFGAVMIGMEITALELLAASFHTALLTLVFGSITFALGASTGKKGLSMGVSVALAIVAYFAHALAPSVAWLKPLQKVSPFYYAYGNEPLMNGFNLLGVSVMALAIAALTAIAVVVFNRRDLSV